MPKSLQLNIPEPCHESWQQMTPNEQGRYCLACQKTVVDFTLMSDRQLLDYISKAGSNVCGRFAPDQLNKEIPFALNKKRYSFAYLWNLLIASFLVAGKADGQTKRPICNNSIQMDTLTPIIQGKMALVGYPLPENHRPSFIGGIISDSVTGQPVEGASISSKGKSKGTVAGTAGNFRLACTGKEESVILECSAVGYESRVITIGKTDNHQQLNILLKPVVHMLKPVTVTGFTSFSKRSVTGEVSVTMGAVISGVTIAGSEKIKRMIKDSLFASFKKSVKIFPNPVTPGSQIQVQLALKETGDYKLELVDAGGRVLFVQPLPVNSREQLITVATNSTWSRGIYWLRITGNHTRNVYEGKILLQ